MNTKNFFGKYISLFLILAIFSCLAFLVSCADKTENISVEKAEGSLVISVGEDELSDGDISLLDHMKKLEEKGEFTFTVSDGMITSIDGVENTDKYWMLYTSDTDNSNSAWGTVTHDGNTYSSASCGAKELILKPDHTYIWLYKAVN